MGEPIKYIDLGEFRDQGYLQELNRQFLHPLGLAMELRQTANGQWEFGGIWDYRKDVEGLYYSGGTLRSKEACEKEKRIAAELVARIPIRRRILGFFIQPVTAEKE